VTLDPHCNKPSPELLQLWALPPGQFLDQGGHPSDIFEETHLQGLAEEACQVWGDGYDDRRRRLGQEMHEQLAGEALSPDDACSYRWCAAINADRTVAERIQAVLPARLRLHQELLGSIIERPLTLEVDDDTRGAYCANCAEQITGRAVKLQDRHTLLGIASGWLEWPIHYCGPCIRQIADHVALSDVTG
jgi:hypothetical protein